MILSIWNWLTKARTPLPEPGTLYICYSSFGYPSHLDAVCEPYYMYESTRSRDNIYEGLYRRTDVNVPFILNDRERRIFLNQQVKRDLMETHIKWSKANCLRKAWDRYVEVYFMPDFKVTIPSEDRLRTVDYSMAVLDEENEPEP